MPYFAKNKRFSLAFFIFCLLFLAFIFAVFFFSESIYSNREKSVYTFPDGFTVIIDAGHGGEDGGATGANGILEKELNLTLAKMLCQRLDSEGINCVMTRSTDTLLYDRSQDYEGRKKALDAKARIELAKKYPSAIFVSIHQNAFPVEKYSGFQVYYSENDGRSAILAKIFEDTVRTDLQPDNNRHAKSSDGKIYILDQITCPAVLLECGFISNIKECELLCSAEYQKKLVEILAKAVIEYNNSLIAQ